MIDGTGRAIALAGATGDPGGRVLSALVRRGVDVRALVSSGTTAGSQDAVRARGGTPIPVDFTNTAVLTGALAGIECVVSVVNGVDPVILDLPSRLLEAAGAAGVPGFIPSDYSLDFTKTTGNKDRKFTL